MFAMPFEQGDCILSTGKCNRP